MPRKKRTSIELTAAEQNALIAALIPKLCCIQDTSTAEAEIYPAVFRQLTGEENPLTWIGSKKKPKSIITLPKDKSEEQAWTSTLGFLAEKLLEGELFIEEYRAGLKLLYVRFLRS